MKHSPPRKTRRLQSLEPVRCRIAGDFKRSKGIRDDFKKDTKGNLAKASANWPAMVEKKGK
jgi:hypothetical protein